MARVRPNSNLFPFSTPSIFDPKPASIPTCQPGQEGEAGQSSQTLVNNDVSCIYCQASFVPSKGQVVCPHCSRGQLNPHGLPAKKVLSNCGSMKNALSFSSAAIRNIRNKEDEAPGIGRIVNKMLKKFGSLDDFCESWMASINAAKTSDPGSAKVLRAFEVITKFVVDANRIDREEEAVMVSRLSDDELKERLSDTIVQQIRDGNPQMISLIQGMLTNGTIQEEDYGVLEDA